MVFVAGFVYEFAPIFLYVLVLLWGASLCIRRKHTQPHAARWGGAAVGLIVFSALVPYLLLFLYEQLPGGFQLLIEELLPLRWTRIVLSHLPGPLALACLFWAAFGGAPPEKAPEEAPDDVPPVFRYDDGSVAPTR